MAKATKVVYLNGTPYVEGQGLVYQSCAGSTCHANGAVGAGRNGAPHGLNFDVQPLTKSATDADLAVLKHGINEVRDEAEDLWSAIDSNFMPPPKVGERPDLNWFSDAAGTMPAMLTALDLSDARDKVRNWLACAAPIVAATTDSPQASKVSSLGSVMNSGAVSVTVDFTSIYDNLLKTCVSCHSGAATPYKNQVFDATTKEMAYMTLVNKDAFSGSGAMCSGKKLVTPNNCMTSVLYQKLTLKKGDAGLCGDPMPLGQPTVATELAKAVCDWITAGAKQ
jgi:hypothetical protein